MATNRKPRGHVYQDTERKSWFYVITIPGLDGKRRQERKRGFARKGDAEDAMEKRLREIRTGGVSLKGPVLFGDFLLGWLKGVRKTMSETGWTVYEHALRLYVIPYLADVRLDKVTSKVLSDHYDMLLANGGHRRCKGKCKKKECEAGKPLANETVRAVHRVIHTALEAAVEDDLIGRNYAAKKGLQPKPGPSKIKPWTEEQSRLFLTTIKNHRLYAMWLLLLSSGMRRGEVCGLRWQDIDLDRGVIIIRNQRTSSGYSKVVEKEPKATSKRNVWLTPTVIDALRAHRKQQAEELLAAGVGRTNDYTFTMANGEPYHPNTVTRMFSRLLERHGLPKIRLHDTRHTVATLLLAQGVHPKVVQEILGHSSYQTTMNVYSHYAQSMGEAASKTMEGVLFGEAQAE